MGAAIGSRPAPHVAASLGNACRFRMRARLPDHEIVIADAAHEERVLLSSGRADVLRHADPRLVPAAARLEGSSRRAEDGRRRALHAPRLLVSLAGDLAALAVALRLSLHHLEEARCIFESREPCLRVARPARGTAQTSDGGDRPRRAEDAAECEGTKPRASALPVHESIVGGHDRKVVPAWPAKPEQAKDAGRPRGQR